MKIPLQLGVLLLLLTSSVTLVGAEVRFAKIFADNMVLQRDKPIVIWGKAKGADSLTVLLADQFGIALIDDQGDWAITFDPLPATNTEINLQVNCGDQSQVIKNVVVGEVWHACGQSNMAMTVGAMSGELESVKADIAAADLPAIRFCRIDDAESPGSLSELLNQATWTVCSPATSSHFSGAAFYFARRLQQELGVPIGVIDSSRGGTPIEPFIPTAAFDSHPTLQRELERGAKEDLGAIWRMRGGVYARDANWLPGRLFNSRIAPITRFAARGLIWYQGESNCGVKEDPRDYQFKMRALVNGWRATLQNEKLPVYYVQLPGSGAGPGWPYLREQQRLAADLPNTGMVTTIDLLGEDIHPANKVDVGERLARWALAQQYGKQLPYCGPMFQRQEIKDDQIVLHFQHADSGLRTAQKEGLNAPQETPDAPPTSFEITDNSGVWRPAAAKINGQTIVVTSSEVPLPIAARYGYAITPANCNLYNRDGLPMAPFCSQPELLEYDPGLPQ